jgi:hypothetical protein
MSRVVVMTSANGKGQGVHPDPARTILASAMAFIVSHARGVTLTNRGCDATLPRPVPLAPMKAGTQAAVEKMGTEAMGWESESAKARR